MRKGTVIIALLTVALLASPAGAAAQADLSVSMTDSPDPVGPSNNLSYRIVALNDGPAAGASTSISDPIPSGTTFVSATAPAGWTLTTPAVGGTGTLSATNASMAPGSGAIFKVTVNTSGPGPFTNTVTIDSGTTDPNLTNNTAVTVTNAPTPLAPAPATPKKCKKGKKLKKGKCVKKKRKKRKPKA